jgi:hypothetical protein
MTNIFLITVVIVVVIAIVVALFCLCNCCCKLCIETDDFDIEVPKQDVPPPSYLRNETVNMYQVQNQATYETLPQPLPKFGLPKRPNIQNNLQNGISTALPSAPQAYSENSNRICQHHANCQNSPQPLPRFHRPQRISSSINQYNTHNNMTLSPASLPSWAPLVYSENSNNSCQILPQSLQTTNQYNEQSGTTLSPTATGEWINGAWVQNDMTLSPTSMLSSTLPLDSDPPPYSEIANGEYLNGTWVQHSNCKTLPQSLPGASAPESEATYNTQNETTRSPNPILYSYSS